MANDYHLWIYCFDWAEIKNCFWLTYMQATSRREFYFLLQLNSL